MTALFDLLATMLVFVAYASAATTLAVAFMVVVIETRVRWQRHTAARRLRGRLDEDLQVAALDEAWRMPTHPDGPGLAR